MTKEEYIGKYPIVCNNAGTKLYLERDDVLKAMDLYAKQQAIAFLKRHIEFSDPNMYETMYAHFIDNQFIEQQNKTNVE